MIMEEIFYHAITVRRNQYSNRSQQLLFYIKNKDGVEKSWVIKAIHMRFMFLKKYSKLLLAVLMGIVAANISRTIVYNVLSIEN